MTARLIAACAFVAAASLALVGVAAAHPAKQHKRAVQHVKLVVKSDTEHGKKGPDGKWHDAYLPANFAVKAGQKVFVTVLNYDDSPHSFTSSTLHVNKLIKGAKGKTPGKATFSFVAPKKTGKYVWWCNQPCDPWAMAHVGYMRGIVTVRA